MGSVFSLPCGCGLGNTHGSWPPSSPILDPQKPSESQSTCGLDTLVVTEEMCFSEHEASCEQDQRHEEAPDCLQMSERHPAGRPACAQIWFLFQGCWDKGPVFMRSRAARRKLSSLRAVLLIGDHLSFWSWAADIHTHVLRFPRTLSVDLCWRWVLLYALFSLSLVTHPQHCRPL